MQVICNTNCYETDGKIPLLTLLQLNGSHISAPCGGKGTCQKCRVFLISGKVKTPEGEVVAPNSILACESYPLEDCAIAVMSESIEVETNDIPDELSPFSFNLGMAVDIGTTTIAIDFYDLDEGIRVVTEGVTNRQRAMGADVITRVEYAINHGNEALTRSVVYSINDAVQSVQAKYGIYANNIKQAVVSGNSIMLHLLCDCDVSKMAQTPYQMSESFGITKKARELGLKINPDADVYIAPCPAAFVGADIALGVMTSGMLYTDETTLLVDIGTNGEIALCHRGKLYCAATAAGPAFEGANIEFGMAACEGAISEAFEKNDTLMVGVIGGGTPKGICGSGLLDAISVGLDIGAIDETGLLIGDDGYYLDINSGIEITQRDVREVQLAKSAICSGIATLVEYAEISFETIDKVLLAGGFGAKLNINSACAIGLIPYKLKNKIYHIGNSSLKGAGEVLVNPAKRYEAEAICRDMEYIELADSEFFSSAFIENMMF